MKELLESSHGGILRNRSVLMNRPIPNSRNQERLVEDRFADRVLECRFMDKGAEVVLIWEPERGIRPVEPMEGEFQRAACVEAGGARIGGGGGFRFGRGLVNVGPLCCEEGEIAQSSPRKAWCSRALRNES